MSLAPCENVLCVYRNYCRCGIKSHFYHCQWMYKWYASGEVRIDSALVWEEKTDFCCHVVSLMFTITIYSPHCIINWRLLIRRRTYYFDSHCKRNNYYVLYWELVSWGEINSCCNTHSHVSCEWFVCFVSMNDWAREVEAGDWVTQCECKWPWPKRFDLLLCEFSVLVWHIDRWKGHFGLNHSELNMFTIRDIALQWSDVCTNGIEKSRAGCHW